MSQIDCFAELCSLYNKLGFATKCCCHSYFVKATILSKTCTAHKTSGSEEEAEPESCWAWSSSLSDHDGGSIIFKLLHMLDVNLSAKLLGFCQPSVSACEKPQTLNPVLTGIICKELETTFLFWSLICALWKFLCATYKHCILLRLRQVCKSLMIPANLLLMGLDLVCDAVCVLESCTLELVSVQNSL